NLGEPEIATREDAEARRACCLVAQRQRRTRLRQHELAPRLPHRPVRRRLVVPLHEILRTLTPRDPNRLLEAQRRRLASTLLCPRGRDENQKCGERARQRAPCVSMSGHDSSTSGRQSAKLNRTAVRNGQPAG